MPDLSFFLKVLSVILQYGILLVIYYFLYLIVRLIYTDLKSKAAVRTAVKESGKEAVLSVIAAADERMKARRFAFAAGISIGRGQENDIVVDDTYVSHHHAVINLVNNIYIIEDLNSVNHTYLNGAVLRQKAALQDGDIIKIGLVTFKFKR